MVIVDMSWLRHLPLLVFFLSMTTLLFEIYFPVLVMFSSTRKFLLGFGVLFHFGIALLVGIWSFSLVMIAPYILFASFWDKYLLKKSL